MPAHDPISHLAVVERADAFAVAPASANTIAKLAAGICDSFLTTSFLACTAPRIVAPAMNARMWEAEATQANVRTLRERGIEVLEPGEGDLASRGEQGVGRMPEPAAILAAVEDAAAALDDAEHLERSRAVNRAGMRQLQDACRRLSLNWLPSVGNFLCVDVDRPGRGVFLELLKRGVIVRPVDNYGLPRFLRISIGTEAENARLIEALNDVLKG